MTSEARSLINALTMALSGLLPAGACLFAWWKGGPAERYGSSIYAVSVLGTMCIELVTGQATPVTEELFLDTAVAVGFLALAIRYNNLWLGAAMMVKGLQLGMHATRLTDGEDAVSAGLNLYALGLNLIALVILAILFSGTIASMRQRARSLIQAPRTREPADNPRERRLRALGAGGGSAKA